MPTERPPGALVAQPLSNLNLAAAHEMASAALNDLAQAAAKARLKVGISDTQHTTPKDPLRVPTNWWSPQDQAFFNTVLLTTGVCVFSIVVRHLLLRIPGMRQRVFEPRVHEGTEAERRRQSGADERPVRGWWIFRPLRAWRAALWRHEVALDEDMQCGLEVSGRAAPRSAAAPHPASPSSRAASRAEDQAATLRRRPTTPCPALFAHGGGLHHECPPSAPWRRRRC